MRNKGLWLTLLSITFFYGNLFAQNKLTIDKVVSVTLRNTGQIIENEQIKGYYFFYQSDKVDRKTNEYTLQIVDENLNKIKDVKFTDSKNITLLESSYNGNSIVFMFYDDDQNMLDYRLYNMDGKQSYTYSKTLDKKSEKFFKTQLATNGGEESENKNVFDVQDKGYITITSLREDRNYTYDVNFYSSTKRKTWTYNPLEDGKFTSAQFLGANDSIAVFEVMSKEKLMSKDLESTLLGINLENGKKAFEVRTQDGSHQLYPMNITTLDASNQFILIGTYYAGNDRVLRDNSDGLGIWLMNSKGKIERSKYITWANDLSKFLKVDQKGRVSDLGYIYFHRLVQTEDGRIFAVGEGYKKVADGVGIAMNILTQSYRNGVTKLKITDMLMLELSKDFNLQNAKIYEKNNNSFSLNTGSDFLTPHSLALAAKAYGAFDYNFTQYGASKASFTVGYSDYERSKEYSGQTFNSISYYDGKITTDKINLKTKATQLHILPAKPGSVLLVEYYKKDKRLDMRMEKLN
jgi:hypothetical protein